MIDQCLEQNLNFFVIPVTEKGKYIKLLSEEDTIGFKEWVQELQKIEKDRLEMFYEKEKGETWKIGKRNKEYER